MFTTLAIMAALLGASSFGFGILPLSFAFSKNHLERLSALGTGLLLGAALGVIIPEGIEAVVSDKPSTAFPSSKIAISLLAGFVFMLVIEQLVSPGAHSHSFSDDLHLHTVKEVEHNNSSEVEFDAELGDLEREQGTGRPGYRQVAVPAPEDHRAARARAYPLTFGLVVHGLADGLALGVSSLSNIESGGSSNLSFIVFLALIIHKAPTSLALTTSLLATTLPRAECKKHLAIFSASTPISAIASYLLFTFFGDRHGSDWTGSALLLSGGTFLYVATVLQPVSNHSMSSAELRPVSRVFFISLGMFIPFLLSAAFGHEH